MNNLTPYIQETIKDLFQKSHHFLLEQSLNNSFSKEKLRKEWFEADEEKKRLLNAKLLLEMGVLTEEEAEEYIEKTFIEQRIAWDKMDESTKEKQNVSFLFYYDVISEHEYLKYKKK